MNILITGGGGFIGSHLVNELLEDKNNNIVVLDDFSSGKLFNLPKSKRLVVIGDSILNDVGYSFKNIDLVYHLGALTRPRWSIKYPIETNKVNIEGTIKVLQYCLEYGVKRIVFTSSASVYGDQSRLLLSEDMVCNPMSPYAVSKLAGEEYCKMFSRLYGLEFNIIRPFNVYGTRQSLYGEYSACVSKFIDQLSKNETVNITGDGKQVRDFVHVSDVVDLMITLGKSKIWGETFNAGTGISTSVNDIYTTISALMNKDIAPNYIDPVVDPQTKADMNKALNLLIWRPKMSLIEGLQQTI